VVDVVRDEQAHDLHEGHLDGIGVFENGEDEGGEPATFAVSGKADAFILEAFVKETETVAAQGG
jgi:hypothetical protein